MKKFATLTIGQAPRPDLAPVFNAIAPAGTEVVHAGCLDGLTKAEVDKPVSYTHLTLPTIA